MTDDAVRRSPARAAAMMWLPVIGLNRHTPTIGLAVRPDHTGAPTPPGAEGVQAAVYQPICDVVTRA